MQAIIIIMSVPRMFDQIRTLTGVVINYKMPSVQQGKASSCFREERCKKHPSQDRIVFKKVHCDRRPCAYTRKFHLFL